MLFILIMKFILFIVLENISKIHAPYLSMDVVCVFSIFENALNILLE